MNNSVQKTKRFLLLAVTLLLTVLAAFSMSYTFVEATPEQSSDITVAGASVRIADDGGSGLRFTARISSAKFEEWKIGETDGYTTGMLLIPSDMLAGDLTSDTENVNKEDTTEVWKKVTVDSEEYAQSSVYLYDIPLASYSRKITARAYVKDGDNILYYSAPFEASIGDVAADALTHGSEYTAKEIEMLNAYTEKAETGNILHFTADNCGSLKVENAENAEFVQSYKGGENLFKIELVGKSAANDYQATGGSDDWAVSFWHNYYKKSEYDTILIDVYAENTANLTSAGGLMTWKQPKYHGPNFTLKEGWNYAQFASEEWMQKFFNNTDGWFPYGADGQSAGIRLGGNVKKDSRAVLYYQGIRAVKNLSSQLIPTNAKFEALDQEFPLSDNASTLFADCTDIKIELTHGTDDKLDITQTKKFIPTEKSAYTVAYSAVNADGVAVWASYTVTPAAEPKDWFNFDSAESVENTNNKFNTDTTPDPDVEVNWLESKEDKDGQSESGVVEMIVYKNDKNKTFNQSVYYFFWNSAWKSNADKSEFTGAGYTKFKMRIMLDGQGPSKDKQANVGLDSGGPANRIIKEGLQTTPGVKKWYDLEFDADTILNNFDSFSGNMRILFTTMYSSGVVYAKDDINNTGTTDAEKSAITLYIARMWFE